MVMTALLAFLLLRLSCLLNITAAVLIFIVGGETIYYLRTSVIIWHKRVFPWAFFTFHIVL